MQKSEKSEMGKGKKLRGVRSREVGSRERGKEGEEEKKKANLLP